ncbi:MAG: acyl-ACP desaturase [Bacteroidota bacterium]
MEIVVPAEKNEEYHSRSKAEVLREIEPIAAEQMEIHLRKRRLWFPSEFIPADERTEEDDPSFIIKLRERARSLKDSTRVSVALNLLTEEGLPHFHRLLSRYLGDDSIWFKWNTMWTAEEDRHGCILRDYARDARLFRFQEIEMMQYAYQAAGFTPDWDKDPYKVFVYTTLQERATQISHQNTGKLAGDEEPLLKGILRSVAADEAKHFTFYRRIFEAILEVDPNQALKSALDILPSIEMPGVSMPDFKEMADVVRRVGIYGPWDYKRIVEGAIKYWKIDSLTGLNEAGQKAQERIMAIPKRLQKVAEYLERRTVQKSFSFEFIYGRILVLD